MMKIFLAISLFAIIPVASATAEEIGGCKSIADGKERLACYDAANSSEKDAPKLPNQGKWKVVEKTSVLDDSQEVVGVLLPESSSSTGFGEASAYLRIGCDEKVTSVIISTEMFMSSESPAVTYRIGNAKAVSGKWSRSTDYKAVGLWNGKAAIPFIKALDDEQKLFIRLQDKDKVDAEFDVRGVGAIRDKVAKACGWS